MFVLVHRVLPLLLLAPLLSGCVAAYGASTGVSVNSKGETAIMARGWLQSGPWMNKDDVSNTESPNWAMLMIPSTVELGAGYDIKRRGLRLEFGLPAFGFASAPKSGEGNVLSANIGAKISGTVFAPADDEYFVVGGFINFSLSPIRSSTGIGSGRADWRSGRTYNTIGLRTELTVSGGTEWGSIYIGPSIERLTFYSIHLTEGPQSQPIPNSPLEDPSYP